LPTSARSKPWFARPAALASSRLKPAKNALHAKKKACLVSKAGFF
jgi:hypothetical protein